MQGWEKRLSPTLSKNVDPGGAARTGPKPQLRDGSITYGVIAMDSYPWQP